MRSILLDPNDLDYTAPIIVSADGEAASTAFTPKTLLQMLEILRANGQLTCNAWQKQCLDVHQIAMSTFHDYLKRITNDDYVNKPDRPERGKSFYYSLSDKGVILLG